MVTVATDTDTHTEHDTATKIDVRLSGILLCRTDNDTIVAAYADGAWLSAEITR